MVPQPLFEVDKKGMADVFARKGIAFIVTELIQNAWDEDTTQVDVTLESLGHGKAKLVVEDDNPEGFKDLSHAYTLFAPSLKKGDPEKRGRFNLGEKLVIVMHDSAMIQTTKGTVVFTEKGRVHSKKKRKAGTRFEGVLSLTKEQVEEISQVVSTLIPPEGIETTFNLEPIKRREPVTMFEATLRTEISDDDGRLKPTTRKTGVELFDPLPGEVPTVYELGIPVVEIEGDRFHVDVGQKVPVPLDRDNLPPAYLRHLRVEVLNHAHTFLSAEDLKATWVNNALEDERVSKDATRTAFEGRFGEGAVISDPSDPEANKLAMEQGLTVVPGAALPKKAWGNVKGFGLAKPAGQVTPSMSALISQGKSELEPMNPDHWPSYVRNIADFATDFAEALMGVNVEVQVVNDPKYGAAATYEKASFKRELTFNLGRLGHKWFEADTSIAHAERIIELLIHEFAHEYEGDHFSTKYTHALTKLGARAVGLAFEQPELFDRLKMREAVAV